MTNNTNSPRVNHRNNVVKNIVIVVLLVLLLCVLAYVAIISRSCSSQLTSADSSNCEGVGLCDKCSNDKLCELYAKIDTLSDEKSKLEAELQDAQGEINVLKYENASLSSSRVDLSNYVLTSTYNALEKKYNALVATHSNCRNVDLSQYVIKSAYNELNAKYNDLVATHANCKNVVDLSKYVAKEEYEILNIRYENLLINYNKVKDIDLSNYVAKKEYDELQAKYDEFYKKWNGHKCLFLVSDHSDCVRKSEYDSLVERYNELDRNYRDLSNRWNNHVCSGGTTVVEADHSACVSLSDYRDLEARYNDLLNQNSNTSSRPIFVDENGNIINP